MGKRNAREKSDAERLERIEAEKNLDRLIPIENDPFDDGDDDMADLSYKPSPKKSKRPEVTSEKGNLVANSVRNPMRKKLTPRERIERLKRKTLQRNTESALKTTAVTNNPSTSQAHFIDLDLSRDSGENLDSLFEDLEEDRDAISRNEHNTFDHKSVEATNVTSTEDTNKNEDSNNNAMNLDLHNFIRSLNGKIDDLSSEILALRKQIARMEAKSMYQWNRNSACAQNSGAPLGNDIFLDFESSLSAEGLPIKSFDGVIALEAKLKETSRNEMSYRKTLVRGFFLYMVAYFHLTRLNLMLVLTCFK